LPGIGPPGALLYAAFFGQIVAPAQQPMRRHRDYWIPPEHRSDCRLCSGAAPPRKHARGSLSQPHGEEARECGQAQQACFEHLQYLQDRPHANLLLTMLNRAGIPLTSLGNRSGLLAEV